MRGPLRERRGVSASFCADTPERTRIAEREDQRTEIRGPTEANQGDAQKRSLQRRAALRGARPPTRKAARYFLKRSSKAWQASLERGGAGAPEPAACA